MTIGYSTGQPTRAPGEFTVEGELSVAGDLTVHEGTFAVDADTGDTTVQGAVTAEAGFAVPYQDGDSPQSAFSVDAEGIVETLGNVTALGQIETPVVIGGALVIGNTTLETDDERCFLGAPSTQPDSSALALNQITFYIDESTDKLKVKVKYHDGTVKTGEIALS